MEEVRRSIDAADAGGAFACAAGRPDAAAREVRSGARRLSAASRAGDVHGGGVAGRFAAGRVRSKIQRDAAVAEPERGDGVREIGRASCRERVEISVVAGAMMRTTSVREIWCN